MRLAATGGLICLLLTGCDAGGAPSLAVTGSAGGTLGAASTHVPAQAPRHQVAFRQVVDELAGPGATLVWSAPPVGDGETASAALQPCLTINTDPSVPSGCEDASVVKEVARLGDCSKARRDAVQLADPNDPARPVAACARAGSVVYVLAPAYMQGSDVKSASVDHDPEQGYLVTLDFTGKGSTDFGILTGKVASLASPMDQVAIVVDGLVVSAPAIEQAITGGNAQITGGSSSSFTQADVDRLAQILNEASAPG